jgi:hypothetical protein
LALNWNLGEEIINGSDQRKAFTLWFHDNDPYRHHVVFHTGSTRHNLYETMLGGGSKLTGASIQPEDQTNFSSVFLDTQTWVKKSFDKGRPWVVACDEPGDSQHALRPDNDAGTSHTDARKNALWGNPMAGGAGVEWYFGVAHAHSDFTCQDFRSRAAFWPFCRHMQNFWKVSGAPFWEMANFNTDLDNPGDYRLAKAGSQYVIYLKSGGSANLTLPPGTFDVLWYDPRNGGSLQISPPVTQVTGGGSVSTGSPPSNSGDDWVVLVRKVETNTPPVFAGTSLATNHATAVTISVRKLLFTASDAEGHTLSLAAVGPSSARGGTVTLGSSLVYTPAAGFSGKDVFPVTIQDTQNGTTTGLVTVIVGPPSSGGGAGGNPPSITINGSLPTLRFQGIPGVTYTIQRSANLVFWQTIYTGTANGIGTLEYTDATPLSPNGFYRLNTP